MLKNTQSITAIEADKRISLYCPLGKDFYTADILVKFYPDEHYMDYIDLDDFLNKMSGLNYTIEDAVDIIYEELQRYKPLKVIVTLDAYSNTHLHVKVTKGESA